MFLGQNRSQNWGIWAQTVGGGCECLSQRWFGSSPVDEGAALVGGCSSIDGGGKSLLCMQDTPSTGTGAIIVPIAQLGTELQRGEMSWPGLQRVCSSLKADLLLVDAF